MSSFRATGLMPYDPAVLSKLAGPPTDQDDWIYETGDVNGLDLDITLDEESWLADQVTPQNVR